MSRAESLVSDTPPVGVMGCLETTPGANPMERVRRCGQRHRQLAILSQSAGILVAHLMF